MSAVMQRAVADFRRMTLEDLGRVLEVERSAYSHPWSEAILRDCLRVGYHCWVCESNGEIVAHGVLSVAVGEAHLLNLCVAPRWQGRGVGRSLLRRLMRVAAEHAADTLFLEVRESNLRARALYQSEGFGEIGRRRGYYPAHGGKEDALMYAKAIIGDLPADLDRPRRR